MARDRFTRIFFSEGTPNSPINFNYQGVAPLATRIAVLQQFTFQVYYDLVASIGQFISAQGYVLLAGINSSNYQNCKTWSSQAQSSVMFASNIQYLELDMILGDVTRIANPSITATWDFIPQSAVAPAAVNSKIIRATMAIDFYDIHAFKEKYE